MWQTEESEQEAGVQHYRYLLDDNGHHVTIWSIDPEEVKMLNEQREHAKNCRE